MKYKPKIQELKKVFFIAIVCLCIGFVFSLTSNKESTTQYIKEQAISVSEYLNTAVEENQVVYLSDISYKSAKVGWGSLQMDGTPSGQITLVLNGSQVTFKKGIWAHATSEIVYDLTNYKDYAYFTTYYGVNTSSGNKGDGVKFYIMTSVDGNTWTTVTEQSPSAMKSSDEAKYVKIDIRNVNYIKLYANQNSANGNDHSVWADTKLIKEDYNENVTMSVEEYDELIKSKYNGNEITDDLELLILQRELVSRVGQYQLRTFVEESQQNKETLEWLLNDQETLRLYLVGGKPEGSYLKSLQVLSTMYSKYKSDLETDEISKYGTPLKDVYRTMILACSLTYSGKVYLWINGQVYSTPENRYEIYKELYSSDLIESKIFETLTVEEMRWVMNTIIDDEEIEWLNSYVRNDKGGATGPYSYIRYTFGYNYLLEKYYSEDNYEMWDKKYHLSDWNITYEVGHPKLWIVFEEGAVCGGISKTGSCIWGAYKGLPNTCISQPAHCAYLFYSVNNDGNGVWQIGNNVGGWAKAGKTEHLNVRMMNDWGNSASGWTASYILLAQAAQNEYDKYEKAEVELMLSKVYDDSKKQEEIYNNALNIERINYDAWTGLVDTYLKDTTKTEEDYYNLAKDISDSLMFYPRPMYDLLSRIESKFVTPAYIAQFDALKTKTLTRATQATSTDSIQASAVKEVASSLLGWYDPATASFSFDGENAGAIVLSEKFGDSLVEWDYSLDGGITWKQTGEKVQKLTDKELASITSTNDIKVHIIGVNYEEDNIWTIDIKESTGLPKNLYANDLENKLIASVDNMEWRFTGEDMWTLYSQSEPDLTGDKSLEVRMIASGTTLASNISTYTFTEDNQPNNKKYIPIAHLSIADKSTDSPSRGEPVEYAIDGNINTMWHTDHTITNDERYIVIKLDERKYISSLQYVRKPGYQWGIMKNAIVSTSLDGQNWQEVATVTDASFDDTPKDIDFEESVYAEYVKFQVTKSYDYLAGSKDGIPYDYFASASMINLFEDTTKYIPTAEVEYNITDITDEAVIARLVRPSTNITIINNDGKDTYTFTENGEFTFEFVDEYGNMGSTTASVNWIKEATKVSLVYSTDTLTNEDVRATLKVENGSVEITNNNGENTYTFTKNGEFTFEYIDEFKKVGSITANVDWIDKEPPTAEIEYSVKTTTTQQVIATLKSDEEITIINNDGKDNYVFTENGKFTFEYVDKAGNIGSTTASVDWIKEAIKVDLLYSTDTLTNEDVIVTIKPENGNIEVTNNDGKDTYTFTENGKFTFEYVDEYGNIGSIEANVDYIDKTPPTAEVEYNITEVTTSPVRATIKPSEKVTILNNEEKDHYIFNDNGEFTFEFVDEAGNIGSATAKVNWIRKIPGFDFEYSTEEITNDDVIVNLIVSNANVEITNNNGSNTYIFTENGEFTFEYVDEYGVEGSISTSVDWIDKIPPTVEVEYSTILPTNTDVIVTLNFSEDVIILNEELNVIKIKDGTYELRIDKNSDYQIEFIDIAGNKNVVDVSVDWIDKEKPTAYFSYSVLNITTEPVEVTLIPNEKVTIINNDGKNTYTFTDNGEFTFEFVDEAGNKGSATARVDWIREKPEVKLIYSTKSLTNEDVTVELISENVNISISNNNQSNIYTFTQNGEFTFEYTDEYGVFGYITASVNWIDKEVPNVDVEYSTTDITNQNVEVTLKFDEEVTITNEELDIKKEEDGSYILKFNDNVAMCIEYKDKAGNVGCATILINWIDKEVPSAKVTYNKDTTTDEDVIATIEFNEEVEIISKDIEIEKQNNNYMIIFNNNGKINLEFKDKAGNIGNVVLNVDWIERNQKVSISYSTTLKTDKEVIAKINSEDNIIIKNNNGNDTYIFTENGEFIFEYIDKYGNEGEIIAKVDWIESKDKKEEKSETENTSKEDKDVIVIDNHNLNNSEQFNYITSLISNYNITANANDKSSSNIADEEKNEEYIYSSGNIIVNVFGSILDTKLTLVNKKLNISDEIKAKVGKLSECYELYLEDENQEKINLNSNEVQIKFAIDSNKKFLEIYKVNEDNTIEKIEYKILDNNILVVDNELGKYILSYEEKENNIIEEYNNIENESKINIKNYVIVIIIVIVIILAIIIYLIKNKKKK